MKSNKNKKARSVILIIAVIAFIGYFGVSFAKTQIEINKKEAEVEELSEQYSELQLNNQELEAMLENGDEADIIERIAREERGYVYPDEKVFFDATP